MSAKTSRQKRVSPALGVAFLAIACAAVVTTTARAQENVTVVGGDLTVLGSLDAFPVWTLVGDGISVVAGGGDTGNTGGESCFPCVPGSSISMLGIFTGETLGSGLAVINGAHYRPVFFAGQLNFHANGAVMPDFDGNSWRNITVPFNLGTNSFSARVCG